ncbi:hypothetical protein [Dryocola sp. BD586]|uniref:hypothetical protein n=1 Tax=Dryocola sp. BD586 TaxID=3133271 RepID=UPI003F4F5ABD
MAASRLSRSRRLNEQISLKMNNMIAVCYLPMAFGCAVINAQIISAQTIWQANKRQNHDHRENTPRAAA